MLDSTTFTLAVKGRPSRSSRRSRIDPGSRCRSPRARQPRRLRSTRVTTPRPSSDALSWMSTRGERLPLRPLAAAVGLLGVMWCGTRTILGRPPGALKGRATAATRVPFGRYSTPDADSPYAPRHRRERAVLRDLRPARAGPRRARSPASPSVLAGLGGPGARHPLLAAGGGALAPVRPLPARRIRYLPAALVTYAVVLGLALGHAPLQFPDSVVISSLFQVPSCSLLFPYLRSAEATLLFPRALFRP